MNNLTVQLGRLVATPELRTTLNGKSVTNFTIAVNDTYRKNEDGDYEAYFFDCVAWNTTAENICKYFGKGNRILVNGKLTTRLVKYTDKKVNAEVKYNKVEIMVEHFEFIDKRSATDTNGATTNQGKKATSDPVPMPPSGYIPADNDISDDDYPF